MSSYEKMIESFDGTRLYMKKDVPDNARAIAVVVHGLCEHQGRYDYVVEKLNENGIGAYRFDHRGHGRSDGERTYFSKFDEPIDDTNVIVDIAFEENPGVPVFLIGHSMGGYTVSLYGAKYTQKGLSGIVTSGALTHNCKSNGERMSENVDMHEREVNQMSAGVCSVQSVVDWYEKDPYNTKSITNGLRFALQQGVEWFAKAVNDFTYPVLMLHGEADALIDVNDTYKFFNEAQSKDKQMKIYAGLYHEIFNEYCRDEVIGDAINWIKNRI